MNDHQRALDSRFRDMTESAPPPPWQCTFRGPIGGFQMLGFAPGSELLLVVSASGRGVFDCETGKRVARNYDTNFDQWSDETHLSAKGIGPLEGHDVKLAGMYGGGLRTTSGDGWSLHVIPFDWTEYLVLLCPRWLSPYDVETLDQCCAVHKRATTTACGFSLTGRSFVIMMEGGWEMSLYNR